jgi:hypothetical protein
MLGSYIKAENACVLGFYTNFVYGFNIPGERIDSPVLSAVAQDLDIHYKFDADKRSLSVNDWSGTQSRAYFNNGTVGLFASNPSGRYPATMKCRYCQINASNGSPVRNFAPVRVGTEGAMMDVLTRRIYRNAGTGAFTYGNDLKYPIPAE